MTQHAAEVIRRAVVAHRHKDGAAGSGARGSGCAAAAVAAAGGGADACDEGIDLCKDLCESRPLGVTLKDEAQADAAASRRSRLGDGGSASDRRVAEVPCQAHAVYHLKGVELRVAGEWSSSGSSNAGFASSLAAARCCRIIAVIKQSSFATGSRRRSARAEVGDGVEARFGSLVQAVASVSQEPFRRGRHGR